MWGFDRVRHFTTSTGVVVSNGVVVINFGGGTEVAFAEGIGLPLAGDRCAHDGDVNDSSNSGGLGAPISTLSLANLVPVADGRSTAFRFWMMLPWPTEFRRLAPR